MHPLAVQGVVLLVGAVLVPKELPVRGTAAEI